MFFKCFLKRHYSITTLIKQALSALYTNNLHSQNPKEGLRETAKIEDMLMQLQFTWKEFYF